MKQFFSRYIGSLYFTNRLYALFSILVALFVCRFFLSWLGVLPFAFLLFCVLLFIADYLLLFLSKGNIVAVRTMADRLSNGDENTIRIDLENNFPFTIHAEIIDEIPHQFQKRDVLFQLILLPGEKKYLNYQLRPVKRGNYQFGTVNVFIKGAIQLLKRRCISSHSSDIPVYPSYLQMRKYQLMAISNRLSEAGVKKIRRFGHSMEFEQIKEYVTGDDYRTLNWKATARRGQMMVNTYSDEKSQQIYCVIDKSRVMKMPFEQLSLLDYAINASLVLSNVALGKQDRAGIITFSEKIGSFLKAEKKASQMQAILDVLYNQKTRYLESDYERLYSLLKTKVTQRSLVILFTNFESLSSMHRQLPYLKKVASQHLLLVIFFENTELKALLESEVENTEQVYTKTIAEKFAYEKRQMVKELTRFGIMSILTSPKDLTVNALNKYLEIKARNLI